MTIMKVCCLHLLSLLLSLAALCAAAPLARADNGGVLDFAVPNTDAPKTVAVLPAATVSTPVRDASVTPNPAVPQSAALNFDPSVSPAAVPLATTLTANTKADTSDASDLFAGGSDSLIARTVGHAEGTRTADGGKTRAYYGHVDPGNGVWNLGSFSYQHTATSPEDADDKQLQRLKRQRDALRQKAAAARLQFSLAEELNGIDLANQSPLAALDTPGYVEWLAKAHERGLTGSEAVLWARTQSYWNPKQERWEAPGLGNTEGSISHDQQRRQSAIARALDTYEQQVQARQKDAEPSVKVANKPPPKTTADQIIFQDLSPARPKDIAVVP